jgi:hypothetical protein
MLEFLKLQGLPSTSKFCYTLIYVSLPMQIAFENNQIDITANTSSSSTHIRSHSFCLCLFMRFPAKFFSCSSINERKRASILLWKSFWSFSSQNQVNNVLFERRTGELTHVSHFGLDCSQTNCNSEVASKKFENFILKEVKPQWRGE